MRMSHFFIERPVFAAVLSILLTIVGAIAQRTLPVAEYPDIAPPTVNISTYYPGASAEVIAETVATPLEQKVNGVVLCAVFIPAAYISGLQGAFYQQFAITIAGATLISAFVSLTLSPALAAILLKPHQAHVTRPGLIHRIMLPVRWCFSGFNWAFDGLSTGYGRLTGRLILGVTARDFDRNILVDIGLIVLVGLAAKNAILIVEFAKQAEDAGETPVQAAISAARTRLRPILMTSFAFIFGVVPLVIAHGAGAEMRQSLGTAVFAGMLGVTIFGLLFTPTFYVLVRYIASWLGRLRRASVRPKQILLALPAPAKSIESDAGRPHNRDA
jgi:multidrug efflux pump subunit AcrB